MSNNHVPPRSLAAGNSDNSISNAELLNLQMKNRKAKKRKVIIIVTSILLVVFALITVLIVYAIKKVNSFLNQELTSVQEYTIENGSFGSSVSGSGVIEAINSENIDIKNSLSILDVYVKEGDKVKEGDLLVTVTNSSLMNAISQVQEQIDAIDTKIANTKDDKVSDKIKTSVDGRIKQINCKKDDKVSEVMYENNSLILLSLDGYMALDIESDDLKNGDNVVVITSDNKEYEAKVDKCINGLATILVSDKETTVDDKVTVKKGSNVIGSGNLYIHNKMAITGFAGTIKDIKVSINQKVKSGDTLLTLKDTKITADYDALLKSRSKLEDDLNELLKIYKEGGIRSTSDGVIDMIINPNSSSDEGDAGNNYVPPIDSFDDMSGESFDYNSYQYQANEAETETAPEGYIRVAKVSPNSEMSVIFNVNEEDILKLKVGQSAHIKITSLGYECDGVIDSIDNKANNESGFPLFKTIIKFEKTDKMLSGMSADIKIKIDGKDDVLIIPIAALNKTGKGYFVYTDYDSETNQFGGITDIKIGLIGDKYAEVLSGINEGTVVYYQNNTDIWDVDNPDSDNDVMGDSIETLDDPAGINPEDINTEDINPGDPVNSANPEDYKAEVITDVQVITEEP